MKRCLDNLQVHSNGQIRDKTLVVVDIDLPTLVGVIDTIQNPNVSVIVIVLELMWNVVVVGVDDIRVVDCGPRHPNRETRCWMLVVLDSGRVSHEMLAIVDTDDAKPHFVNSMETPSLPIAAV